MTPTPEIWSFTVDVNMRARKTPRGEPERRGGRNGRALHGVFVQQRWP